MKKLILTVALVVSAMFMPGAVNAQTTTVEPGVCVSVYGGGVVCGAKHEIVDTDLGDINPAVLGGAFIFSSAALFLLSKKMRKVSSQISG